MGELSDTRKIFPSTVISLVSPHQRDNYCLLKKRYFYPKYYNVNTENNRKEGSFLFTINILRDKLLYSICLKTKILTIFTSFLKSMIAGGVIRLRCRALVQVSRRIVNLDLTLNLRWLVLSSTIVTTSIFFFTKIN